FELKLESRFMKIGHAGIDKVLKGFFILVRDQLSKDTVVLHGREPEFRNTLGVSSFLFVSRLFDLCTLSFLFHVFVYLLANLNLFLCRISLAIYDVATSLVD